MVVGALIGGAIDGETSFAATKLTANASTADATLTVSSTSGFYSTNDYVMIGNEKISYATKDATHFYGCVRGDYKTKTASYVAGQMVYSRELGAMNGVLGINKVSVGTEVGAAELLSFSTTFFSSVGTIMLFDYSFFDKMPFMFIRILMWIFVSVPIAIGLIYLTIIGLGAFLQGLVQAAAALLRP
jgi:hypothetical protein